MSEPIKIITASNGKLRDLLLLSMEINLNVPDYEVVVYDIGGLGFGIPFVPIGGLMDYDCEAKPERIRGKLPIKPHIIMKAMQDMRENERFLWLDADAFLLKPVHDVFEARFDVAVTLRPEPERKRVREDWMTHYGYINAGVMFFRNTEQTRKLVHRWGKIVYQTQSHSDQEAMNVILLNDDDLNQIGKMINVDGVRVKLLTTKIYNWYYFPNKPKEDVCIAHLKSDKRTEDTMNWARSLIK